MNQACEAAFQSEEMKSIAGPAREKEVGTNAQLGIEKYSQENFVRIPPSLLILKLYISQHPECSKYSTPSRLQRRPHGNERQDCGMPSRYGNRRQWTNRFYRRHQMLFRTGLFYCAAPLSGAFGGLLATGLAEIQHGGHNRWPWIFIVEGVGLG